MSDKKNFKEIMGELQWKTIGISVLSITVLQLVAFYAMKYPLFQSLSLTVLLTSYIIVPRAKTHKMANAFVGVLAVYILGLILVFALDPNWASARQTHQTMTFLEMCLYPLLLGIAMAYAYMRLTSWSERKRADMESKRKAKAVPERTVPVQRVHRKKRKK